MKNLFLVLLAILSSVNFIAQEKLIAIPKKSPLEKIQTEVSLANFQLEYSRPSMRGREIFGVLVPYDKIWRTGANINTKIVFSEEVDINGNRVEAGSYSIFTKPGQSSWEIYFHTELNEYGAPETLKDENVLAQINVPVTKTNKAVETLSISFENLKYNSCELVISWENTSVSVPISVPTSEIMDEKMVKASIHASDEYAYAAWNYFDGDKNPEKGIKAIDKAIDLRENGRSFEEWVLDIDSADWSLPWCHQIKSEMHAMLGQNKEAIAAAKKSLLIANKLKDANYYIKKNTENLKKWE